MSSALPKHTHVDKSLARGLSRQIIHDALQDMDRRRKNFSKKSARLTTLPRSPKKRVRVLAKYFSALFGSSLICQVRKAGKREASSLMFFLDYFREHQVPGAPIVLEVCFMPISPYMKDVQMLHSGIRISRHVLERIIQRNGARSMNDVTSELRLPILYLFFADQEESLDMPPGTILKVPSPNGMLICGNEGDQPYDGMVLKTFVTFIHVSQMTDEQRNLWHYTVSKMPDDISRLYPPEPGDQSLRRR